MTPDHLSKISAHACRSPSESVSRFEQVGLWPTTKSQVISDSLRAAGRRPHSACADCVIPRPPCAGRSMAARLSRRDELKLDLTTPRAKSSCRTLSTPPWGPVLHSRARTRARYRSRALQITGCSRRKAAGGEASVGGALLRTRDAQSTYDRAAAMDRTATRSAETSAITPRIARAVDFFTSVAEPGC
jgi:hypothetical protein